MIPSVGRIVHYKLSQSDVLAISQRREDARKSRIGSEYRSFVHVGNPIEIGQIVPMIIVRVWGTTEESAVNGQAFLDGNDTLWLTSVQQGEGERQWSEPLRVKVEAPGVA